MEVVDVYCQPEYDPPNVVIVFAGQLPFTVSTAVYEYLRTVIPGLPENPCAAE